MSKQLYYKGQPVEELTKEELIQTLVESFDLYHNLRRNLEELLEFFGGLKSESPY